MRLIDRDKLLDEFDKLDLDYGAMGGVAECIAITEESPIIEPNKSTDQDVPSGDTEQELCELAQTKKRLLDIGDELIAKLRKYTIPAIAESIHQLDEVDFASRFEAIQSEREKLALQKAISIINKVPSVEPGGYMCFSCKYGSRVGMPCKECKHDYEDKYTPINEYETIPRLNVDLISRESAICAIENTDCELTAGDWDELTDAINELPSADAVSREEYNKLLANSIWESKHIGKMLEYKNETEPSGDLISREDAMKAVYLLGKRPKTNEIWDCLDALPSAVCDDCIWRVCNYNSVDWEKPDANKFCPNCGADMRKDRNL